MFYDVLTSIIANLIAGRISKPIDRIERLLRKTNVRFVVFGNRASGKTTLIHRMFGSPISTTYAPTVGLEALESGDYISVGRVIHVENLLDFGGDEAYWPLWNDAFARDRPMGIIFMIDHDNIEDHLRAFHYMVDFISKNDRSWLFFKGRHVLAREQLKAILFLVNKSDEWSGYQRLSSFLTQFENEFQRIKKLGIPIACYACSALEGTNVDNALSDFFTRMLGNKM